MANKSLTESTTDEQALRLYNTHMDDLERAVAKIDDYRVLGAAYIMAFQKDKNEIIKVLNRRAKELKISLS